MFYIMVQPETRILVFKNFTASSDIILISSHNQEWQIYVFGSHFLHIINVTDKLMKSAATWQNQQSDCAPSEVSDQPWHPPSLIRVFAVRMNKP